ncbi:hypothetical protein [Desulfosarcina variabilis]|uniref:hypothetical protein n=1 Tax=Desulfosarcina variabilis TaxID=2300 RepID=UPI003AFA6F77
MKRKLSVMNNHLDQVCDSAILALSINPLLVDHMTGFLESFTVKIMFVSVSGGHESTSAVQFKFIQNISFFGKNKMLLQDGVHIKLQGKQDLANARKTCR